MKIAWKNYFAFIAYLGAAACQAETDGQVVTLEHGRAYLNYTWPPGEPIQVCFEELVAEQQRERTLIRKAIAGSWEGVSAVEFEGWGRCEAGARGLRIALSDEAPHTNGLGEQLDGVEAGVTLNVAFENWSELCKSDRDYCIAATAIHELGHGLGFAHEQNRPDTPAWCQKEQGSDGDLVIGEFDTESVMNYCNVRWNGDGRLSAGDIQATQTIYGSAGAFKTPDITRGLGATVVGAQWLAADLDGDGRTDLVQVAGDAVQTYRSEGGPFTVPTGAAALPAGSLARLTADLDGDGRSEVLQLADDAGQLAATVVGAAEGTPRIFLDDLIGPATHARARVVGDVDGDHAEEVVQILERDQKTVLSTLGMRHQEVVVLWENDGIALDSQRVSTWHAADIDGDDLLDVVEAWSLAATQGFTVYRSTGHGFAVHWASTGTGPLLRASSTAVGDFNDDGRSDLLQVIVDSDQLRFAVFTASGTGLRGELGELGPAPVAPLGAFVRDFDGDGLSDLLMPHARRDRLALAEFRSTGDGLTPGFSVDNFGADPAAIAWLDGDVDGDGRGDLIQIHDAGGQLELKVYRSDL